ncbi:hypothetical protein ERX35_000970 [Macrococcus equipercicus]|uniref:Uncharacterized protein n=1 Tax=Macrococcus equipercicus TaxID=69967 RepID=A0ABQ6RBE3_9STAP|nr:hypothetical protein [Macrococcus equipercicus]KAA1042484.1 hypothetical protein ERX35_000970 [Macrococcus equipercicus]
MGIFFNRATQSDNELAASNKVKQKVKPKQSTVKNTILSEPDAKYMKETSKALQILFNQERDFHQSISLEQELRDVKDYLESPNEQDFLEVIDRERELELLKRFNKPKAFNVPSEMLPTLKSNLQIEREQLDKTITKNEQRLKQTRKQIDELIATEKQLADETSEQYAYMNMAETMEKFLQSPDDAYEWGMSETNQNGQAVKKQSWLKRYLYMVGYPLIFVDNTEQYFKTNSEKGGRA